MKNILKAMLELQNTHYGLQKVTPGHNYKYMTLDDILNKVRPHMTHKKLLLVQNTTGTGANTCVETVIYHTESGEMLSSGKMELQIEKQLVVKKSKDRQGNPIETTTETYDPQKLGSAITYMKRYQLAAMLGICVDTDDDAAINNILRDEASKKAIENNKATEDEIIELLTVAQTKGFNDAKVEKAAGKNLNLLTSEEVKALIERLNKK